MDHIGTDIDRKESQIRPSPSGGGELIEQRIRCESIATPRQLPRGPAADALHIVAPQSRLNAQRLTVLPERELMLAQGTNEIHIPAHLPKDVAEGSNLVMTAV